MRVLLVMDQHENRRLLMELLAPHYQVATADTDTLQTPFDLGILDGPALVRLSTRLQSRKAAEHPVFLPLLLVTSHQGMALVTEHLWHSVDDVIVRPIEKTILLARVETLMRTRRLSLELKRTNGDLQAFIHAMTHDLGSPLRAIAFFAKILERQAAKLDEQGRHDLERIHLATSEMQQLLTALLEFSRIGRDQIHLQPVSVHHVLDSCLLNLQADIRAKDARVTVTGELPTVQADLTLLKVALTNLISNAIKYVAPNVRPQVTVFSRVEAGGYRLVVQDNGIGVAPENQQRIFTPFVRLHGVEEYPGVGLGLPTVRKVVELMGGRLDMESSPGMGSSFWIDLGRVNQ